jgi:N-acetylglucosaminyl-diphospho-decaprenol L-rhamnosyltransferase
MQRGPRSGVPPCVRADIAAVIVAYRSSATLAACLDGLRLSQAVREIVVVDNSSDAGTRDVVEDARRRGAPVRYYDPGENLGFAAGCNRAVALTVAPLLLLLNPDVELHRDIEPLAALIDSPETLVAGGLEQPRGPLGNVRRDATLWTELRRATTGLRAVDVPPDGRGHIVDQVDGALMLVARTTYTTTGGLREEFPLYYEDVEMCWRIRRRGGRVCLHAVSYGSHIGGASSAHNPSAYIALRISRQRYLRLRYGASVGTVAGLGLAALELLTRTAAGLPEAASTRTAALAACWREARRPLTEQPLR